MLKRSTQHLAEAVYEDQEFLLALNGHNRDLLLRLITHRNAAHRTWGFKVPGIHVGLEYRDFSLFRNPHLILVFRDPVAVAEHTALAEFRKPLVTMRESLDALRNLLGFVENTTAPALLLSYEKALMKPTVFIDALATFAGLSINDAARNALLGAIQPESKAYIQNARRQYIGLVEHIVDNVLYGWCHELGSLDPVPLELSSGGREILGFQAAGFRPDLLNAQFGNGNHGFSVDLRQFQLDPDQTLEVRIAGREFILPGSGKRLREYYRA
ncbi:MAG: hypothetical protein ACJ8AI_28290 [Rhodopila sp.]